MKVVSKDILHKSEAGGVRLDLTGAEALRSAFDAIQTSALAYKAGADIAGMLVTPMADRGTCICWPHSQVMYKFRIGLIDSTSGL